MIVVIVEDHVIFHRHVFADRQHARHKKVCRGSHVVADHAGLQRNVIGMVAAICCKHMHKVLVVFHFKLFCIERLHIIISVQTDRNRPVCLFRLIVRNDYTFQLRIQCIDQPYQSRLVCIVQRIILDRYICQLDRPPADRADNTVCTEVLDRYIFELQNTVRFTIDHTEIRRVFAAGSIQHKICQRQLFVLRIKKRILKCAIFLYKSERMTAAMNHGVSFVVQIEIGLTDGQTLRFQNTSDEDCEIENVFLRVSPKELGKASSIDRLIAMLKDGATTSDGWDDETTIFSEDSEVPEITEFLGRLKQIPSMNQIESIRIVGTEYMGNENDRLDLTYNRKTKKYSGKRYGRPIDEHPNGGCGGNYMVSDLQTCSITEALTLDGKVVCEGCGSSVEPEHATFVCDSSGDLYRFCSKHCFDNMRDYYYFDEPVEVLDYNSARQKFES